MKNLQANIKRQLANDNSIYYDMVTQYQLLDSGNKKKLEKFADFLFVRPEPKALWKPTLSQQEWQNVDAIYTRSDKGGGYWKYKSRIPESWRMKWQNITFKVKPTGFKHMGIFPEHEPVWKFVQEQVKRAGGQPHILNLFGYTGAATLAAAAAGAKVTHVDGSKDILTWARENTQLSGLANKPIRWIPEDATTYCKRELKRGVQYEGIIIDAPSFGRGAKGEVWKLEEDLPVLLDICSQLLSQEPLFVVLISYGTDYPPVLLKQMVQQSLQKKKVQVSDSILGLVQESNGFMLPLASAAFGVM